MDFEKYIYVGKYEIAYIGRVEKLEIHSHITWTLCICMDGDFTLHFKEEIQKVNGAILVPPKWKHKIESKNSLFLFIFFEKYSNYFSKKYDCNTISYINDPITKEIKSNLNPTIGINLTNLKTILYRYVENLKISIAEPIILDPRVESIIESISANRSTKDIPIKKLASKLKLSESRISHLFKENMGIPISSYRIWVKIKRLATSLESGKDLTFSAQEAGFFDSSHLNRVFKNYFGIVPKKVFLNSKIKWLIQYDK